MQKRTNAGKPAGKKPDRRGLFGLFAKKKDIPTTAQQTLHYREMYRDGVCRVSEDYYTKTIEYEDINYQLAQAEDQAAIFDGWSACLNYFDSTLPFQLSFLNHRSRPESRYSVNIPMQDDEYALIIERQKSLCKCKKRLFFKTYSYIIYRYNIIGKHQWLNLPIDFYEDNFPIVCDIFLLLENRYEALKMAENYRLGHKPSGLRDTVR